MIDLQVTCVKAGLFTSIQDGGRSGWQEFGIPSSGFLDRHSARLANLLVGNSVNGPVLEMTYTGVQVRFSAMASIAITGAQCKINVDGRKLKSNRLNRVEADSVLRITEIQEGARVYLAIAGTWQVETAFESASPLRNFLPQNRIQKGDHWQIRHPNLSERQQISELKIKDRQTRSLKEPLSLMPGPEISYLSKEQRLHLVRCQFEILPQSNRMALLLSAADFGPFVSSTMLSSGLFPGTIQCTPSGQLMLLLADSQTSGGYPRVAVLHDDLLDLVAQARAGEKLSFQWSAGKFSS